MFDPDEGLRKLNLHPDTLKRYDELLASKEPKPGQFGIPISPMAMLLIGHIIVQWGNLQDMMKFELQFRGRINVPPELSGKTVARDPEYQIAYLREAAPYFLAGKRQGALSLYIRNLNQISNHRFIRNAVAHGSYSLQDNEGFAGAVVQYQRRKLRLRYARLEQVGNELGKSAAFFFNFWDWADAAQTRGMQEAFLQKLLEHHRQSTSPGAPEMPLPPPGSLLD